MLKRYTPLWVILMSGCLKIDTPSHECSGLCIVRDIYAVPDTADSETALMDADTADSETALMDAYTADSETALLDADTAAITLIDYGVYTYVDFQQDMDAEWDCVHIPEASCQVPDRLFELPSDANCIERPTFDIGAWNTCFTAHPILSGQERRVVSLGRGDASLFSLMLNRPQSGNRVLISGYPGNSTEPPTLEGNCVGSRVGAILIDSFDGKVKYSYWLVDGEEPPSNRTVTGLHQYTVPYYILLVRDHVGNATCEVNLNINIE